MLLPDPGLDLGALPDGQVEHHPAGEHVGLFLINGRTQGIPKAVGQAHGHVRKIFLFGQVHRLFLFGDQGLQGLELGAGFGPGQQFVQLQGKGRGFKGWGRARAVCGGLERKAFKSAWEDSCFWVH